MPDPATDLQSKICRAIRALLIAEGAGSTEDTFVDLSSEQRALPNTTIECGGSNGEVSLYTGLWKFPNIILSLRDAATVQPTESNPAAMWRAATERYDLVRTALSRVGDNGEFSFLPGELTAAGRALAASDGSAEGDQRAEDNTDMADFTITWWRLVDQRAPRSNSEGTYFESELQFECHACNGNIS